MIVVGVALGVLRCYFGYKGVVLDRQPLCLVMEENFDQEESVFGDNGHFFREVNMDGFGQVFILSPFFSFLIHRVFAVTASLICLRIPPTTLLSRTASFT